MSYFSTRTLQAHLGKKASGVRYTLTYNKNGKERHVEMALWQSTNFQEDHVEIYLFDVTNGCTLDSWIVVDLLDFKSMKAEIKELLKGGVKGI